MPSWPTRLFSNSAAATTSSPSTLSRPDNEPATPVRNPPIQAPSSSVPRTTSHHGRSISHPFPSIFGSGKKKSARDEDEEVVDAKVETTGMSISPAAGITSRIHTDSPSREGKCATCDSNVRWPQQLNVFRCTVCLMINDLKPNPFKRIGEHSESLLVPCVSLARTQGLIDACVSHYVESFQASDNACPGADAPYHAQESLLRHPAVDIGHQKSSSSPRSPNQPRTQSPPQSPSRAPSLPPVPFFDRPTTSATADSGRSRSDPSKAIFRNLENYILACFSGTECLNASFLIAKPPLPTRAKSESSVISAPQCSEQGESGNLDAALSPVDAKTLLLGNIAENGTWWTGGITAERSRSHKTTANSSVRTTNDRITMKSPLINWKELSDWYHCIFNTGRCLKDVVQKIRSQQPELDDMQLYRIEEDFHAASMHLQRTLLKASENLLRRPGTPLKAPAECRFLLILLANPLLYPQDRIQPKTSNTIQSANLDRKPSLLKAPESSPAKTSVSSPLKRAKADGATVHSGITKRILGLLSNLPSDCHRHLIAWFSLFSEPYFRKIVDLVGSFITYRLSRQHSRKPSHSPDPNGGLIPSFSGSGTSSSAQLHAALGISVKKTPEKKATSVVYSEDWQIRAAARVMSLLFSANSNGSSRRQMPEMGIPKQENWTARTAAHRRANRYGQLLPTNTFYNTLLDYSDLVADFEAWESRRGRFSFCQYPMFISIWAKIRILEHDARRQMEIKAREAFFDSIINRKAVSQYLVLKVRRDCLVEDSLRGVSEVVGTGQEEIKKGLRIEFTNEEGVDAGGLRKEWFLLLVREVFDPEHGLFVYDEDSQHCYFNPASFETSDQFFLVGVVLGLAIYNSTILDVALPPFAFRRLLASAPAYTGPTMSSSRPVVGYTLDDLAEFRPVLAKGLQQLLDFDGDVEETFCRDFVAEVDRYGQVSQVPLCPKGEHRAVTNSNRREFVDLYVRYLLDTAVARQYEPFKRGFFSVCGGNALSLFRPEEIELLVRGSDEPLDVATLRAVATYEGWGTSDPAAEELVIIWFWEAFETAQAAEQRSLLSFITASDRIPAMGAASLVIKIALLGDEWDRFPTARTCFNRIGLYRYSSRQQLESKLWRAVAESEGFGLK